MVVLLRSDVCATQSRAAHRLFLLVFAAVVVGCGSTAGTDTLHETAGDTDAGAAEVTIESGRIRGAVEGNLHVFHGIPYAAPPIGDRRFRPPAPASAWKGVRITQG